MKTPSILFVTVLAALCGCVEEQPVMTYNQPLNSPGGEFATLPPAVQNSVRAEAGMGEIAAVTKNGEGPAKYYEIRFRNPVLYPPLYLATDGSVLNPDLTVAVGASADTIAASIGSVSSGVRMDDLPPSVIMTIRHHAPTAEVDTITRITSESQLFYSVTFKDPEHHPELLLHDDGKLAQ
jgi:hypothetical protein